MKKKERKALGKYVRYIANEMGLRDWTFNVMRDPPDDENAEASCHPTYGRKVANLYFARNFPNLGKDRIRHTVIHELLHCHFAQIQFLVDDLSVQFPYPAYTIFKDSFRQMHEGGIDGVADSISDKFPHIDWNLTE